MAVPTRPHTCMVRMKGDDRLISCGGRPSPIDRESRNDVGWIRTLSLLTPVSARCVCDLLISAELDAKYERNVPDLRTRYAHTCSMANRAPREP